MKITELKQIIREAAMEEIKKSMVRCPHPECMKHKGVVAKGSLKKHYADKHPKSSLEKDTEKYKNKKVDNKSNKVDVIEIDQWLSSGDITKIKFDSLSINKIVGGDSEAIKQISGGHFVRKSVDKDSRPNKGDVWLIKGKNGFPKVWKANYDTSD